MPLVRSPTREAFSKNVAAERSSGRPIKQALAIAYDVQRRAHKADGGAISAARAILARRMKDRAEFYNSDASIMDKDRQRVGEDTFASGDYAPVSPGSTSYNYRPLTLRKASGGGIDMSFAGRAGAKQLERSGLIRSPVAGRTDALPMSVKSGGYMIPADIVSGIGRGNSLSGASTLDKMFKTTPGGAAMPHPHAVKQPMAPMRLATAGMMKGRRGFDDGGAVGAPTEIAAAGGEYFLDPSHVLQVGGGDLDHGHSILDAFVKHIRGQTIRQLRALKPPRKN